MNEITSLRATPMKPCTTFLLGAVAVVRQCRPDLRSFRRYDQQQVVGGIEGQLPHQATEPSRNRKRLRPNQLAEWELRIGDFRVFYDVDLDESLVKIEAIGYKVGSTLFVHGEEYEL